MGIGFTKCADRHEIPHADSLYAMMHHEVAAEIEGAPGEVTMVYIGHPHGQTDRYISMELTDTFRHLLAERK